MFKSGEFYDMEIIDVALTQSNEKGTPGIAFTVKVTDGEESKAMPNTVWLSDKVYQEGNHAGKTVTEVNLEQLQESFGLPDSMETEDLRAHYVGKTGRVRLENETYKGKTTLKVKGMYSSSMKTTTVDPSVLAKLNGVLMQFKPVTASKTTKKSFFPPKGK
jgi:hypothetical protein